jgi:hypothetical protein
VTVSNSRTSKKSTVSKSNHHAATPESASTSAVGPTTTAPAAAPVNAPPPDPAPTTTASTSTSPALSALAKEAIAQLSALEAKLNLNIVLPPNDKAQRRALARVSDTALGLAADIVQAAPASFPSFSGLPDAVSYVQTIGQVASRAAELGTHVQSSVVNQRTPAAQQALALYAVVKGLGRITGNEAMREKVDRDRVIADDTDAHQVTGALAVSLPAMVFMVRVSSSDGKPRRSVRIR